MDSPTGICIVQHANIYLLGTPLPRFDVPYLCSIVGIRIKRPRYNVLPIKTTVLSLHFASLIPLCSPCCSRQLSIQKVIRPRRLVGKMDPTYPLVPIVNFIACALIVIPLFHMANKSWNTGVFVFALWLLLISFTVAVNTIIWSSDAKDRAPVWCDICKFPSLSRMLHDMTTEIGLKASHISILVNTGIPACSFTITRSLYKITRLHSPVVRGQQESNLSSFLSDFKFISDSDTYQATVGIGCLCWDTHCSCKFM